MKVSELLFDDLSDAPNNTCDENEFSDSSNILELKVVRLDIEED